jgi:tRNA pseudouridine-54 N-methylase
MAKKSDTSKSLISMTPSTLKLNQLLANRDLSRSRMLTVEEIDLLRKSKREISEVCKKAFESYDKKNKESFNGFLADKTDIEASLEEINEATSQGWAGKVKI